MKHSIAASFIVLVALGTIGRALPAAAKCAAVYPHPAKTGKLQASFVQMFVSCQNPGGNNPNATTETGTKSCFPAETFAQQSQSSPSGAWLWGPHAHGSVSLVSGKNQLYSPLNTDPDAVDLFIKLSLKGLLDVTGGAYGTGRVRMLVRMTIVDRTASQPMTFVDIPLSFAFAAINGKVSKHTSLSYALNLAGLRALPACSTVELLSLWIIDSVNNRFAELGSYLP